MTPLPTTSRTTRPLLAVLLAVLALLLAGTLAGCGSFPYSNQTLTAQVVSVDGQKVTLQPGELAGPEPTAEMPTATTVNFQRLGADAFQVGNASVYTTDEATRVAATFDQSHFDASFAISLDGEAIAYDSLYVTNEVRDGVTVLTISAGGSYALAGTLPAGQILIDTPDPVRLVLNGVDIANEKGSVVEREQAGTLVIAPAPGKDNRLTSAAAAGDDHGTAAIAGLGPVIVTDDGTGAGAGSLYIESANGDGNESLASTSGAKDGSRTADGAAASPTTPAVPGVVSVGAVTLGISAGHHGLCAENYLNVAGGTLDITAGEDAFASAGDATLSGGDSAVDAGDDAIHSEFVLVVEGGALTSSTCKEGLEAERIYLREGAVSITSSDDGVNASGPEVYDEETPDGYREVDSCLIAIGGGVLRVDASGDGLDSNGSVQMNSGTVLVAAPESGDNTALDYDGAAVLCGGTALLTGTNGMTHGFTEADQGYVDATADGSAGQSVALADTNGTVLVAWTPPRGFSNVTATAPGVTAGQTYHLVIGGTIEPAPATGATAGVLADVATSGTVTDGTVVPVEATTESTAETGPGVPPEAMRNGAADQGGNGVGAAGGPAYGERPTPPGGDGANGATPPEPPNGANGTPPEPPEGAGGAPPERPDDGAGADESAAAPDAPEGEMQGGTPPAAPEGAEGGAPEGQQRFEVSDAAVLTVTVTSEQAATLKAGDIVEVKFGAGETVESITPVGGTGEAGGQPGGMGQPGAMAATDDNGTAATTIDHDDTVTGETYTSTAADENALRVTGGANVTLDGITVEKTAGDTTNENASNFYGMNAGLLVTDGATASLTNGQVTTAASGANGLFAQGEGAAVDVDHTQVATTSDNSGGLMCAGGATLTAREVTVDTAGRSAAAIRSDRGGGTMDIQGGAYTTTGTGSPVIYSTAEITVADATLDAAASEAVVVEGDNSVTLTNCEVSGAMEGTYGADSGENIHGVMLYHSMSGDADAGESSFTMEGGFLGTATGDLFYVTNTNCSIAVSGVELGLGDGVLLRVAGNDGSHGWGAVGANGGTCQFTATDETLAGDVVVDEISTVVMTIVNSEYTGAINAEAAAGQVDVTLDGESTWTLAADSHVSSFTGDLSNVAANGHHLYVAGELVL